MRNILSLLENATNGHCYKSSKYCSDQEVMGPAISFDENNTLTILKDRFGETDTTLKKPKNLKALARNIAADKPLFSFFLDGSRRTYKVDDIELNHRIFPIMAGQIGVACCERKSPANFKNKEVESNLVIAMPSEANPDVRSKSTFLNTLIDNINNLDRIKRTGIKFSKILTYDSKIPGVSEDLESKKYEHLAIAEIQDEMIDCEKKIVAALTAKNILNEDNYLLKDGSLQYKPMKSGEYRELTKIKNNYRRVIGVSKLFNPELFRDKNNKSNAAAIAHLPLYERTPAFMFQQDITNQSHLGDYKFSIWYVRIREHNKTDGPFAGILKIEKILITDKENAEGIDSDLVDIITANIINERNPVCYGKDSRWANHLYPVYLTEQYLKSRYLSDSHFLNLF